MSGLIRGKAAKDTRRLSGGFTLIELLLVIVIIGILAAIALPNYIRIKDKAKEAESKAALHNIQLAVERFAVDSQGSYPKYLIGGNNRWMEVRIGDDKRISRTYNESDMSGMSDPLLRDGYVESYPANPFVRQQEPIQQLQVAVGDPLRSSYEDGRRLGNRFGEKGNLMGQTLCESRWLTWLRVDPKSAQIEEVNTWANVQYEFYDVWLGNRQRPYLPGSFMYKAMGEIVPPGTRKPTTKKLTSSTIGKDFSDGGDHVDDATYPVNTSNYMLAVWGGPRTKGLDMLGEEPMVIFATRQSQRQNIPQVIQPSWGGIGRPGLIPGAQLPTSSGGNKTTLLGVPPWTRGVNRSHVGPLWGSPYGPAREPQEQLTFGNPNGMRDGMTMWLTAGME